VKRTAFRGGSESFSRFFFSSLQVLSHLYPLSPLLVAHGTAGIFVLLPFLFSPHFSLSQSPFVWTRVIPPSLLLCQFRNAPPSHTRVTITRFGGGAQAPFLLPFLLAKTPFHFFLPPFFFSFRFTGCDSVQVPGTHQSGRSVRAPASVHFFPFLFLFFPPPDLPFCFLFVAAVTFGLHCGGPMSGPAQRAAASLTPLLIRFWRLL